MRRQAAKTKAPTARRTPKKNSTPKTSSPTNDVGEAVSRDVEKAAYQIHVTRRDGVAVEEP
ncbi:MAG: hypothetical protein ACREA9_13905 [Pyrinomonadaceae bacterium]